MCHLSTGDPEVDEIDMHNLPVCAIKFLVASLSAAVASPGQEIINLYSVYKNIIMT